MDATPLDERRLIGLDKLIHAWAQSVCKKLGADLGQAMNQANGSKVSHTARTGLFGDERHKRLI